MLSHISTTAPFCLPGPPEPCLPRPRPARRSPTDKSLEIGNFDKFLGPRRSGIAADELILLQIRNRT